MRTLDRFVQAQDDRYRHAVEELRVGRKRTHWMWFVLPQLRGLGKSAMAEEYGIAGAAEAAAYLAHPLLGTRLFECLDALLAAQGSAEQILGATDALKLRSCVTLFGEISEDPRWSAVLDRFYGGQRDARTLDLLAEGDPR